MVPQVYIDFTEWMDLVSFKIGFKMPKFKFYFQVLKWFFLFVFHRPPSKIWTNKKNEIH